MAKELELDIEEITYLIEQFKKSYNVEDPLTWIKNFIAHSNKNRLHARAKTEQLHGIQAVDAAHDVDTAETRKLKERKLNLTNRLFTK